MEKHRSHVEFLIEAFNNNKKEKEMNIIIIECT